MRRSVRTTRRHGAGDNQFGVKLGEIREAGEEDEERPPSGHGALEDWELGCPASWPSSWGRSRKNCRMTRLDQMVRAAGFAQVADWLNCLRRQEAPRKGGRSAKRGWLMMTPGLVARGWSLTSERIGRRLRRVSTLSALLDRIESEMGSADPEAQWTMNFCLAGIGIHFPEHRKRAIAIGEKLWACIATIRFPKAAPRRSRRSGSRRWSAGRREWRGSWGQRIDTRGDLRCQSFSRGRDGLASGCRG
jgi:hypothetical protein